MRAHSRINISNNAQYHQDLADHYTENRPEAETATANGRRKTAEERGSTVPTDHEYLAALHADVAQQLRDVLAEGAPPAIVGEEPPVTRSVTPVRVPAARPRRNATG